MRRLLACVVSGRGVSLPDFVRPLPFAAAVGAALVLTLTAPAGATPTTPPEPVLGTGIVAVPKLLIHAGPSRAARVLKTWPEYRPEDFHPTPVVAVSAKTGVDDQAWYRIIVPGRPNGRRGWVRGSEIALEKNQWQVVIYRGSRELQLWKGDRLAYRAKVAVGAPGMETPLGLYYVTFRFRPVKQPFLGTYAFATSAFSKLSDWPGGGVVGLHGTYQPWLLGQAVSHGCVRMSNETANFLRDRIPVGTLIRILPA
jgi:lipoprotein-anchoring transpeptidase ErfK/SrfK